MGEELYGQESIDTKGYWNLGGKNKIAAIGVSSSIDRYARYATNCRKEMKGILILKWVLLVNLQNRKHDVSVNYSIDW